MTCVRARRLGIICTPDSPLTDPNPDCPNAAEHTPQPAGYIAWHDWAARMDHTHYRRQCPGCGLRVIHVPKTPRSEGQPR